MEIGPFNTQFCNSGPIEYRKDITMFKNHLEMIGRNETASKKAKFWQSFVRSLKGSDDIRASDSIRPRSLFRPLSDYPEFLSTWPSASDHAASSDRSAIIPNSSPHGHTASRSTTIQSRLLIASPYQATDTIHFIVTHRYRPVYHITKLKPFDADKAWRDHLDRVSKREPSVFHTTYPFSRYPLYLVYSKRPAPPTPVDPHRDWLDHLDRMGLLDRLSNLWPRYSSPTPIKPSEWAPRPSEVAYNYAGQPIYSRSGLFPTAVF
ncbi:Myofilin [Popillia japonica]|uniref:Myofilin n=1 Tax=Popillia japonica TaxID=7064 RepID=A0AAW1KP44_POPJA